MDGGIAAPAKTRKPKGNDNGKLTALEVTKFVAQRKSGEVSPFAKLFDGKGMYLTFTKAGTPAWRMKYRYDGVERVYPIGVYPDVSLSQARDARDEARAWLDHGKDPVQAKKLKKATEVRSSQNTFAAVTALWLEARKREWSDVHYKKSKEAFERDVLPIIGTLPVADIDPGMVASVIKQITKRGTVDTARKVRQHIKQIFDYAQAEGMCTFMQNPAEPAKVLIPKKVKSSNQPAIVEWKPLADILRDMERARVSPEVRMANRLLAFAGGVRISNVVQAEWKQFHLDDEQPRWVLPRPNMKYKDREGDHVVLLGANIVAALRDWRRLHGGKGFLFKSDTKSGHISREALEKVYRETLSLRGKHVPHGWRSALATLAKKEGKFPRDVIEWACDRTHDTPTVLAYDRDDRADERAVLMTWWDRRLGEEERGAQVLQFPATA